MGVSISECWGLLMLLKTGREGRRDIYDKRKKALEFKRKKAEMYGKEGRKGGK